MAHSCRDPAARRGPAITPSDDHGAGPGCDPVSGDERRRIQAGHSRGRHGAKRRGALALDASPRPGHTAAGSICGAARRWRGGQLAARVDARVREGARRGARPEYRRVARLVSTREVTRRLYHCQPAVLRESSTTRWLRLRRVEKSCAKDLSRPPRAGLEAVRAEPDVSTRFAATHS